MRVPTYRKWTVEVVLDPVVDSACRFLDDLVDKAHIKINRILLGVRIMWVHHAVVGLTTLQADLRFVEQIYPRCHHHCLPLFTSPETVKEAVEAQNRTALVTLMMIDRHLLPLPRNSITRKFRLEGWQPSSATRGGTFLDRSVPTVTMLSDIYNILGEFHEPMVRLIDATRRAGIEYTGIDVGDTLDSTQDLERLLGLSWMERVARSARRTFADEDGGLIPELLDKIGANDRRDVPRYLSELERSYRSALKIMRELDLYRQRISRALAQFDAIEGRLRDLAEWVGSLRRGHGWDLKIEEPEQDSSSMDGSCVTWGCHCKCLVAESWGHLYVPDPVAIADDLEEAKRMLAQLAKDIKPGTQIRKGREHLGKPSPPEDETHTVFTMASTSA